jgi:hypothetical protein
MSPIVRRSLLIICLTPLFMPLRPGEHAIAAAVQVTPPPSPCEAAVTSAEYAGRLPPRMLAAVAAVESGRVDAATGLIKPWPWTINAEGIGQFFATKAQAIAAVKALQAEGVRSIDVGCLQVNLMYHPGAFPNLETAFDPTSNARYAAHFLNALYADSHDWARAIGAYHSQTPSLGADYRSLVMARWERPLVAQTELAHPAYRDFAGGQGAYAAFANPDRVYGAFVGGVR